MNINMWFLGWRDVATPLDDTYTDELRDLLCKAKKLGSFTQASADGYLPNERLNFAMGLASIHIAQMMEQVFKDVKQNSKSSTCVCLSAIASLLKGSVYIGYVFKHVFVCVFYR